MKIGLVGYQGSGKSTLFEWLTGVRADAALAHQSQSGMAVIPDERIAPLCAVYHPKKVTQAALEIVDTPGLSRTHAGSAGRLAQIREAGCLALVVAAFGPADPRRDLATFEEDFILADLDILTRRLEKLRESIKKPRPNRELEVAELAILEPLVATLEEGKPLPRASLTEEQRRATQSFGLLTQKPRLVVFNLADNDSQPERFAELVPAAQPWLAAPLGLELELARMPPKDRAEFERDLQLTTPRRDDFVRKLMELSGQFVFFTAGDKEVRTWLLPVGASVLQAAENIHTDLARGFIRAEVMRCEDLMRLGSEREVKAHNLMRHEHKDYVVRDGDIVFIRHH